MTSKFGSIPTLIPLDVLQRWERDGDNRRASWLANMIELRGYIEDAKSEGERVISQMYDEAAPRFGVSSKRLQNKMSILRAYTPQQLTRWIVEKKLSIDVIELINHSKDNPAEYIELMLNGDGDGNPPTRAQVEQLLAEETGRPADYWWNVKASKFAMFAKVRDVPAFLADLRELVKKHTA